MDVRWFLPLIALANALSAEGPTNCVTPNHENGTCIPYSECGIILEELEQGDEDALDFARTSVCGIDDVDGEVKLCCGSAAYPSVYFNDDGEVLLKDFKLDVNSLPERSVCGVDEQIYRLAGENFWDRSEFSWTALLEYKSKEGGDKTELKCEGTLISELYVLTSADCLNDDLVYVRLGDWNWTTDPDCVKSRLKEDRGRQACAPSVRRIKVDKVIRHRFHSGLINNIGLVKLTEKIVYDGFARPICLPPPRLHRSKKGTSMTIVGWPLLKNGSFAEAKQRTEVTLLGDCTEEREEEGIRLTQRQCLKGREEPCGGKSGAAVMVKYKDKNFKEAQWYVEGVLIHNPECTKNDTIVYTRVAGFMNWLTYTISQEEFKEFRARLDATIKSKTETSTQSDPSSTQSDPSSTQRDPSSTQSDPSTTKSDKTE